MSGRIKRLVLLVALLLLSFASMSQTTVVMPHLGSDTLLVSPTGCYTILDPGGWGRYENGEDSWLWIVGEQVFYLQVEYEVGHSDDGKDWIEVFYDTVTWYSSTRMGGTGKRELQMWSNRALVHFHSNNYNSFDGFVMRVEQPSTVYNMQYTALSESSVQLTWEDSKIGANTWTVHYWCGDDTILTVQTNTRQVTLNGLASGRYYRYYITNNVVDCQHRVYGWFTPTHDSTVLVMDPGVSHSETLSPNNCYRLMGPSGDTTTLDFPYQSTQYYFNNGHGVYVRGTLEAQHGEEGYGEVGVQSRYINATLGSYNYYYNNRETCYEWFPGGWVGVTFSGRSRYDFEVLPENDAYITPTVTAVTTNGATISWTDTTSSTSWTLRYCKEEGQWTELTTVTPSVTLTGLESGRQYVYSIEGNVKRNSCDVAARWGFVTEGNSDTIVMPYRGKETVVLQPRHCYTVVDAGRDGGYFNADNSRLVLRTANGKGFRVKGRCMLATNDLLWIDNGVECHTYGGSNYGWEMSSTGDSIVVFFGSNISGTGTGFVIEVVQTDDSITGLTASNITSTMATVSWTDNSGATAWTVHYGDSEDNFHTVNVTSKTATITGLTPGVQYVYYVTNALSESRCLFSERRGFITQGLPAGEVLMPFRGIDTLILQPGVCYKIWDAGGRERNYFNNDTSVLVIMSSNGSNFTLDGQWLNGGNEALYNEESYDSYDRLWYMPYSSYSPNSYYGGYDGYYNRFANNDRLRFSSSNGYLKLRFTSNSIATHNGFCFTVDRTGGEISNVKMTRVTRNSATVTWTDNSGTTQWGVQYGPVGGTQMTTVSTVRNITLNNLQPGTDYQVSIYTQTSSPCETFATFFTTLDANSIVMPTHGDDTVYVTPGQCYYIYDPGGTGDYLPSDTSRLVIRSTNGDGFFISGAASVGNRDYSDKFWMTNVSSGGYYFWGFNVWYPDGETEIRLETNEALQERGLYCVLRFPSSVYNPDTLNMTDSTVTITWQDTTAATHWNFSYGTHIDSMVTVTTNTRQCTMTGLERNRQYFYSIYSTSENQDCVLENIFGVIMPTDAGYIVSPYDNRYLRQIGRRPLYFNDQVTLTPDKCYHLLDAGGIGNLFYNNEMYYHFHTQNNQGVTLEGYYDMGAAHIYIDGSGFSSNYYNSGYMKQYIPNGSFRIVLSNGSSPDEYAPGFDLSISFNYKIYNVRTQDVTCTSAKLLWDDSTSATQWTIAYGPTEKQLDTVTVNTKSLQLDSLLPDHQYVCYLTSNDTTLDCLKPVKYCFITTCDTTIFLFPYNKDTTRVLDINECYTIYDGGGDMDYLYNDQHYVWLRSSNGNALTLRGNLDLGDNDRFYAVDAVTGKWLCDYTAATVDNLVITAPSGRMRIYYNSSGDTVTGSGFRFNVYFHTVSNIQVSLKTDTTCRLTWNDNSGATQWVCHYGMDKRNMDSIVTNQRVAHLSNLVYGKRYYVYFTNNFVACIDTTWFEFCAGGDKCLDFGDIYSCFTTAYYGRFNNPNEYKGMVDYGPDDISSRHTLIDDTTATDPRTGGQLRCVPPGYPSSVRLGNWDIGGEAESIMYEYDVDTTKSEVLLMRYAAVLENPGHSPAMQPRFRFSLVNENGYDINTDCYSADFVSSDALGWNVYQYDTNTVLWKDWTAVGVDLAPLHGQRVFVKLTTYDCNEMGHFGYAYFTLECQTKDVFPNECGVVHSNTFTAPEGFRYRWYNIDSSNVTLSTNRTFYSNQNGIYKCRASFLGSTGEGCWFEKTVVVGDIFPYANFTYRIVDTIGCNVAVQFFDHSCATLDAEHTQQTSMESDGRTWDFGDGTVSYDKNPIHIFPSQEFNITLTATLANGACSDDTTMMVLMKSPCISYDTLYPEICDGDTFALRDSAYTVTGDYTVRTEYRPDSIVTTFVHLTVHPSLDTNILGGICDENAYTLFGFNENTAGDYVHDFTSIYGCDSIYRLHLVVSTSYNIAIVDTLCSIPGYAYRDTTFTQTTVYVDSLLSMYSCDSVVTLDLTVYPAYHNYHIQSICQWDTAFFEGNSYTTTGVYSHVYNTTLGCDSIEYLRLTVIPVPVIVHSADTVILPGTYANLSATGADSLAWLLADGTLIGTGNNISVSPQVTTQYYIESHNNILSSSNLVFNGDFELGDTGFYCSYQYLGSVLNGGQNSYAVGTSNFGTNADHTSGHGNFLACDGGDDSVVWMQTIAVQPHTDYVFSFWSLQFGHHQIYKARLRLFIDGTAVGDTVTVNTLDWTGHSFLLNSGSSSSAEFKIIDLEHNYNYGNDFALDDIGLFSVIVSPCTSYDSIKVYVAILADSSVCDVDMPITWNGVNFDTNATIWVTLNDSHGNDSTVVMTVTVQPTYLNEDTFAICRNEAYIYRGHNYFAPYFIEDSLKTDANCDSVVHITLYIHDTTFRADALISLDSINWTRDDSLLYGCSPVTIYTRDCSESYTSLMWLFGDGASSNDTNAVHTYLDSGIFTIMLVASSVDGCRDTAAIIDAIQVMSHPAANFDWDPKLPSNLSRNTDFINLSQPSEWELPYDSLNYKWFFYSQSADNDATPVDSSLLPEPHYIWLEDDFLVGEHDVRLVAYQWFTSFSGDSIFCTDTITLPVTVVNIYLQFPNAVTPNGDGVNDTWRVVNLIEFGLYPVNRLRIYNRWGRLVFQRDNINSIDDVWDPNDCDCPDGTYFYRFDAQGDFGHVQHNGAIEVIRGN